MLDVLIAGAGPAGAMAALVLARAGARVVMIDRAQFPRDKLCGDTLNPGAVRLLASFGLTGGVLDSAVKLSGMRLTGPRASVHADYGKPPAALALTRRAFDAWLIEHAVAAGVRFESGVVAREPLADEHSGIQVVRGLVLDGPDRRALRMPAILTIAADGRRSALARAVGLAGTPRGPRRWAYGTYATGVAGMTDLGEMHVRHGWYFGLAPLGNDVANVCVVKPATPSERRRPIDEVRDAVARDPSLRIRFEGSVIDDEVRVLGPLAAEARAAGVVGLLLAGDAGGFVDPMTGDGVHLALQSGVLAAREALRALETGDMAGAVSRLERARRAAFWRKLRFNRMVRRLVSSPAAVDAASVAARILPSVMRHAVRYAGDVR
jgi:flavin-dependent dehydrogenase